MMGKVGRGSVYCLREEVVDGCRGKDSKMSPQIPGATWDYAWGEHEKTSCFSFLCPWLALHLLHTKKSCCYYEEIKIDACSPPPPAWERESEGKAREEIEWHRIKKQTKPTPRSTNHRAFKHILEVSLNFLTLCRLLFPWTYMSRDAELSIPKENKNGMPNE